MRWPNSEKVTGLRGASRGRRTLEDAVDDATCLAREAGISLSRYSPRHTAPATSVGTCTMGAHPAHDHAVRRGNGDPLRSVYQAIDTGIGQVLEKAGDARVLVVSLHGMSHAFGPQFLLRDLLTGWASRSRCRQPPGNRCGRASD